MSVIEMIVVGLLLLPTLLYGFLYWRMQRRMFDLTRDLLKANLALSSREAPAALAGIMEQNDGRVRSQEHSQTQTTMRPVARMAQ